jgi:hypothetical protein
MHMADGAQDVTLADTGRPAEDDVAMCIDERALEMFE